MFGRVALDMLSTHATYCSSQATVAANIHRRREGETPTFCHGTAHTVLWSPIELSQIPWFRSYVLASCFEGQITSGCEMLVLIGVIRRHCARTSRLLHHHQSEAFAVESAVPVRNVTWGRPAKVQEASCDDSRIREAAPSSVPSLLPPPLMNWAAAARAHVVESFHALVASPLKFTLAQPAPEYNVYLDIWMSGAISFPASARHCCCARRTGCRRDYQSTSVCRYLTHIHTHPCCK
jgi:hypothetical protein